MKIYIKKNEIEKILELMNKFPQESNYQLDYVNSSGLGYTIDMIVPVSIKGHTGDFKVSITDSSNW